MYIRIYTYYKYVHVRTSTAFTSAFIAVSVSVELPSSVLNAVAAGIRASSYRKNSYMTHKVSSYAYNNNNYIIIIFIIIMIVCCYHCPIPNISTSISSNSIDSIL